MKFFSLHKTTFFVATHTGDQFNFIATQPKFKRNLPKDGEFKTQPIEKKLIWSEQVWQNQQIPTSSFPLPPLPPPTMRTYC